MDTARCSQTVIIFRIKSCISHFSEVDITSSNPSRGSFPQQGTRVSRSCVMLAHLLRGDSGIYYDFMRFWYFKFEGIFTKGSPEYGGKGVISNCLVPVSSYIKAQSLFLYALKKNHIELVEVLEYSDVDGDTLDPEDEVNTFWIDWYNETREKMEPVFDTWHTFPI